jgi:hypothetical protein
MRDFQLSSDMGEVSSLLYRKINILVIVACC